MADSAQNQRHCSSSRFTSTVVNVKRLFLDVFFVETAPKLSRNVVDINRWCVDGECTLGQFDPAQRARALELSLPNKISRSLASLLSSNSGATQVIHLYSSSTSVTSSPNPSILGGCNDRDRQHKSTTRTNRIGDLQERAAVLGISAASSGTQPARVGGFVGEPAHGCELLIDGICRQTV